VPGAQSGHFLLSDIVSLSLACLDGVLLLLLLAAVCTGVALTHPRSAHSSTAGVWAIKTTSER
jgi:hypothetical protein